MGAQTAQMAMLGSELEIAQLLNLGLYTVETSQKLAGKTQPA